MRIELFNRKTLYEFYGLKILNNLHISFGWNERCAELTSKEYTLGPSCIDHFFVCNENLTNKKTRKSMVSILEYNFIEHLNNNVGVECLIKKEKVPLEVYNKIKF